MYVKNFEILNLNEKDQLGNIPLYYLIAYHSDDNHRNKEMFLWLCKGVNVETTCGSGDIIKSKMNTWQIELHSKYGKASLIHLVKNPDHNIV